MSRIGYALDLPATVKRLQATFPTPISVEAALWVPDRGIATNISKAVGCDMMLLRGDGGWYAAPGVAMQHALEIAAFRIHPGAVMLWHDDLIGRLRGGTT